MILWTAVWNGTSELQEQAYLALRGVSSIYPQLEGGAISELPRHGRGWAAAVGRRHDEALALDDDRLTIVDGTAVGPAGAIVARSVVGDLDAAEVEGQFAILRVTTHSLTLDTDAFGLRHVYRWQDGDTHVLSNSVEVIARTVGGSLDLEAAARFVAAGWATGDATLCTGVRQLAPAQSWRFDPQRCAEGTHFDRAELAGQRTWRHDPLPVAADLGRLLTAVADSTRGGLYVAMSGGMDSRLIAALIAGHGIPARYYSVGDPDSFDAHAARELAHLLGAAHDLYPFSLDGLAQGWEAAAPGFVAQTDGLVSMWGMGDTMGTEGVARHGGVVVQGVAGELARWNAWPTQLLLRPTPEGTHAHLTGPVSGGAVASAESKAAIDAHVRAVTAQGLDEGFTLRELPMYWYLTERARRWGGSNNRKISNQARVFTPFTTRPFVRAAFRLHWARGRQQAVNHDLVRHLAPALHAYPPEAGAWPSQIPYLGMAVDAVRKRRRPSGHGSRAVSVYQNDRWPGVLRRQLAGRYLDTGSAAWQLVDRTHVEALLLGEDDVARRREAGPLLHFLTVLEYDEQRRSRPAPRAAVHRLRAPS